MYQITAERSIKDNRLVYYLVDNKRMIFHRLPDAYHAMRGRYAKEYTDQLYATLVSNINRCKDIPEKSELSYMDIVNAYRDERPIKMDSYVYDPIAEKTTHIQAENEIEQEIDEMMYEVGGDGADIVRGSNGKAKRSDLDEQLSRWEREKKENRAFYEAKLKPFGYPDDVMEVILNRAFISSEWPRRPNLKLNHVEAIPIRLISENTLELLMDELFKCESVYDVQALEAHASRYTSPGNIETDAKASLMFNIDGVLMFRDIKATFEEGTALIGLMINGNVPLIIDTQPKQVRAYFNNFQIKRKKLSLETFIHGCKKNVLENYDPSLTYTRIDETLIGDL